MKILVDFGGGLDTCFDGQKELQINFESNEIKMSELIEHLATKCNPKKLEFFMMQKSLRPGILVLINDTDWELEERENAVLQNNDRVSFISTLHGG